MSPSDLPLYELPLNLFRSPQLEPHAINHLCEILHVATVFTDQRQEARLTSVAERIAVHRIPTYEDSPRLPAVKRPSPEVEMNPVAYWCHTSGTSSGLPKPIPQTHRGVVAALPCFPGKDKPATYSTTPLYHGGIVDALRAWTSGAMIWFFPEGTAPVTAQTVTQSLRAAQDSGRASIRYFSSVPYILQLLDTDERGLAMLKTMDLVGVGGAALPESVGDRLVENGVSLLSRMGSAECGFLMSSHRDYDREKDWQYLRPVPDPTLLEFKPRENGLYELVVMPRWPFLAKPNQPDGSYATADLFEPHDEHSRVPKWRYHSRSDAQITLSNGKKFDPAPLEASLAASSPLIDDVLIFGAGRDFPGALLAPASGQLSHDEVVEEIWPKVEEMNWRSQNHARIAKSMLVILNNADNGYTFEKSSKGTLMRRNIEARFAKEIENAYCPSSGKERLPATATYQDVAAAVTDCFTQVLGRQMNSNQDLFGQGVDSLSCIQIRALLSASCCRIDDPELPINIVYDQGTVDGVAAYIWWLRQGAQGSEDGNPVNTDLRHMVDLAGHYGKFHAVSTSTGPKDVMTVVLTGATGFLGSYILHYLRQDPEVQAIYCLVRASGKRTAQNRVDSALRGRGLPGLAQSETRRVVCLPCNLPEDDLGIPSTDFEDILAKATHIIHSAWTVNFSLRLDSFRDQLAGVQNLLDLSSRANARFIFVSSTAAVSNADGSPIPEEISEDPASSSPLGYSQSKWVAESICAAAEKHLRTTSSTEQDHSIAIVRVGQLCGDESGVWNSSEAFPLMLSTSRLIGCLPDFPDEPVDWLPVQLAAQAVLEIGRTRSPKNPNETTQGPPVYHVLNPHRSPSWGQLLRWVSASDKKSGFEVVSPREWVTRLERKSATTNSRHPSFALLGLWKKAFLMPRDRGDEMSKPVAKNEFAVTETEKVSCVMSETKPLSETQLLRMWDWITRAVA